MRLYRLTVVLLTGFLFSCNTAQKEKDDRSVFRYNEASGITSLDPAYASNQANIWACNQLFNGLVQLDSLLVPVPCIAKSWEISDDGLQYVFHLRSDIRFHPHPAIANGRTVRATDFVFSFMRICDEKTASPGSWIFQSLQTSENGKITGLSAPDDSTLVIRLKHAFPPLLGLLASAYCSVVPEEVIRTTGKDFRKQPIGTGPFVFHAWEERTALVFHRNPNYFESDSQGLRLPYLDAVMISFISDKQSAFLAFLQGKIDFISGLDAGYKDDLLTTNGTLRPKYRGRFKMETAPYLNTEYLGFLADSSIESMKGSPLNDLRIRQAINYGFDRNEMIRYLRNGMATPGVHGMLPPGLPGYDCNKVKGYAYDPELASKLLTEAGYPGGRGLPEITMSTTNSYQDLCEYIQGQLARLGIRIRLEVNQAGQHRQMVAKQQLQFFRGSWIADYADGENYLVLFKSGNKAPAGPNYTHFNDSEFDRLYDESMKQPHLTERVGLYAKMDSIVMSKSPVVVLYYDKILRLTQKSISGLQINPMNLLTLKTVSKSTDQAN